MSELHRRTVVRCPIERAPAHVHQFISDCGSNGVVRFALRAPVHLPGLNTEISLQRDVIVTIASDKHGDGAQDSFSVDWAPADDGPFPRFHGTLAIGTLEGYDSFALVLEGRYALPSSFVGQTFDAGIGHRIAQATARDLLARVCHHVEGSYRALEDALRVRAAAPRKRS